jgi:hypothetical protein
MPSTSLESLYNKNLYSYTDNNPINRSDAEGETWWGVAGALFGGLAGGGARAVSNIINGKTWYDGVIPAAIGGATTGFLLTTTFNPTLSYYIGSSIESTLNESSQYMAGSKSLTTVNVSNSLKNIAIDTMINGTIGAITSNMARNTIRTNDFWFTPTKFVSSFTGNYAKKIIAQSVTQGAYQIIGEELISPTQVYGQLWCPAR